MNNQKRIIRTDKDRNTLIDFIQKLDITKPYNFEWKKHQPGRSLNQNGLYHMWIGEIARATDNNRDLVHEFFKDKFCPVREIKLNGKCHDVRSTKTLDKAEMSTFMLRVSEYAATDLNVFVTHPEDAQKR